MGMLKEGHVYSYSQLTSFDECPYSFYLRRIEGLRGKSNGFAEQGSLIHDLIDRWAKGELTKDELPAEYVRRYPEEVVTQFPRLLAAKGYVEMTYEAGLRYFENFDEFEDLKIIGTEEKFETLLCGRPFIGIIDMVAEDKNTGELIVLDHKSKSYRSFLKNEDEMFRQQLIYSQYVYEKYGRWPDLMQFNLFKEDGMRISRPFQKSDFDDALAWANRIMEKIETFEMMDWLDQKPDADFFCQNLCDMRDHCSNGQPVKFKRR